MTDAPAPSQPAPPLRLLERLGWIALYAILALAEVVLRRAKDAVEHRAWPR